MDVNERTLHLSTLDLFQLFDRISQASSLNELYDAALEGILAILHCNRGALLLANEMDQIRFVAWRGLSENFRSGFNTHLPASFITRDADITCIASTSDAHLNVFQDTLRSEGVGALAFAPLANASSVFGALVVFYDQPHSFSVEEKQLILVIARQVGFAVERHRAAGAARRLSAIVTSSDDAIISKDLNGVIMTWNAGAAKLFGYSAEEAIGQPITILIPPDRHDEEPGILARIRAGERIDHYETVRQTRSGQLIDISLTVSPIFGGDGQVIGASKIARDISERRRAQEQQHLLMREMDHRVKNLFTLASSIVRLSASQAKDPKDLAEIIAKRLEALGRAHALTVAPAVGEPSQLSTITLHQLVEAILLPYEQTDGEKRISVRGDNAVVSSSIITPLSLLLHEFATNSAKYGSLSSTGGFLEIDCRRSPAEIVLVWKERGGPVVSAPTAEGFGSRLILSAAGRVGRLERKFEPDGVLVEVAIDAAGLLDGSVNS